MKLFYLQSLIKSESLREKISTYFAHTGLSKLHAEKGQYLKAIDRAKLAFKTVKGKRLEKVKNSALLLNGFYKKIQLTDSAYHYYKIYTNANDSIKEQ